MLTSQSGVIPFSAAMGRRSVPTAKAAVGKETNAWRKAQQLEKWVHDNMKVSAAVGFPAAGQICRDLEGDCRQHAVLLTALCRAEKILKDDEPEVRTINHVILAAKVQAIREAQLQERELIK